MQRFLLPCVQFFEQPFENYLILISDYLLYHPNLQEVHFFLRFYQWFCLSPGSRNHLDVLLGLQIRWPGRTRPWTRSFDDLFCLLKFRFYFIECFLIKCFCFQVCHFLCFIVACVILYFRPVWFDPWPWDSSLKFEPWGWKILKISALSFQKKTLSF